MCTYNVIGFVISPISVNRKANQCFRQLKTVQKQVSAFVSCADGNALKRQD